MSSPGSSASARFEAIFEAHHRRALAYALRRSRTEADAEDAVADTFAIAWRRIHDVPDDALPWLLGVAQRVGANRHRSSGRFARLIVRYRHTRSSSRRIFPCAVSRSFLHFSPSCSPRHPPRRQTRSARSRSTRPLVRRATPSASRCLLSRLIQRADRSRFQTGIRRLGTREGEVIFAFLIPGATEFFVDDNVPPPGEPAESLAPGRYLVHVSSPHIHGACRAVGQFVVVLARPVDGPRRPR